MKKIFSIILMLISLNSFGQYIINQTLGSDSTLVTSKGAFKSRLINKPYSDTSSANLERIKFYDGAQIYTNTGSGKFWIRDSANNRWLQLAVSAGVGTVTQVNTGYGLTGGPITTIGTIVWDSATASLKYLRLIDTAAMLSPYQPIITLTTTGTSGASTLIGSTLNIPQYAGTAVTTSDQTITATSGQTSFAFTSVPATSTDYFITVWGVLVDPTLYTLSGGNIVFTTGLVTGDKVRLHRTK